MNHDDVAGSAIDRRGFLGALGVAAFTARDRDEAAKLQIQDPVAHADLAWDKAPCRYCGTGCGVEVGVKDGKVMAVRGDAASPVNKGLLCVKGYHLPAMLYGKDRLQHPQLRKAGVLVRITWDEAIALIAEKFGQALKDKGPDGVAVYGSGQWTV